MNFNTDTLTLSKIGTPFGDNGIRIAKILSEKRVLNIKLDVITQTSPSEFGETKNLSMLVSPTNVDDVTRLLALENMLDPPTYEQLEQLGLTLEVGDNPQFNFEHVGTLNDEFQLNVKLKEKFLKKGDIYERTGNWKFSTALDFTPAEPRVELGTNLILTITPAFYFNDQDGKYGLFYTLKDVAVPKAAKATKRK